MAKWDTGKSNKLVFVRFANETADKVVGIFCGQDNVNVIACWYAEYHSGDKYTIRVDGKLQKLDQNGEIK